MVFWCPLQWTHDILKIFLKNILKILFPENIFSILITLQSGELKRNVRWQFFPPGRQEVKRDKKKKSMEKNSFLCVCVYVWVHWEQVKCCQCVLVARKPKREIKKENSENLIKAPGSPTGNCKIFFHGKAWVYWHSHIGITLKRWSVFWFVSFYAVGKERLTHTNND